jgi:hypothetical protein
MGGGQGNGEAGRANMMEGGERSACPLQVGTNLEAGKGHTSLGRESVIVKQEGERVDCVT